MSEPRKCPTCESPGKYLHPAVQHEGEVYICKDPWHGMTPDQARAQANDKAAVDLLDRMGLRGHPAASQFVGDIIDALRAARGESDREQVLTAACIAHRACCGTEHDPANGKLHGLCVVCGIPWPCETASVFIKTAALDAGKEG